MHLHLSRDGLAAYCQRWKIVEISVIDSSPTENAGADDPVEFLVRFRAWRDAPVCRFAVAMERELAELVGRDVDLVDYRSVVDWSDNYIRRRTILESAQTVYAA